MKKIFLLTSILFMVFFLNIPIINAEEKGILIKNVELIEKNGKTIELETAKFEGLDVWFKLKFFELNDNAKYKIIISNNSESDYEINKDSQDFTDEDYISYEFEYENNDELVKAGTEEEIIVNITYKKEVPNQEFVNNTYTNDNYMNISFTKDDNVQNPNTFDPIIKLIFMSVIALMVVVLLIAKYKKFATGLLVLTLLVPIVTYAKELFKININANIIIQKVEVASFSLCDDVYQFEVGMSLNDWLNSAYNTAGYYWVDGVSVLLPNASEVTGIGNFNNLITKDATYICRRIAECVSPNSEILINENGQTKLAKDIIVNDNVMYYDFETNTMKKGIVNKVYEHKNASNFIRYTLEDNTYIEATDYHPIYTKTGWKSYTNKEDFEKPILGDEVLTNEGYKKLINIETYNGNETFYDFEIISEEGKTIDNYYANGILVHSAY